MTGPTFAGFPDRMAYLPVPASFFGQLLQEIDDLAELKLMLHCWRLIHQQKGSTRFLRRSSLASDRALLHVLDAPESPDLALELDRALQATCSRGVFLCLEVQAEDGPDTCYFLNTEANRQLIERVVDGELKLGPFEPAPGGAPVAPSRRAGVYDLYEQNIGLLTPLLAEELHEAELRYPPQWIEDAFREAVAYNRRSWRYVQRVLQNWENHGRGEGGENRGYPRPPEDARKYLQGRYGRFLKH